MTRAPHSIPPAARERRYQLERRLGEGGSGAVYLAKDLETDEYVALKKLLRVDAKSILRLKREFRALAALSHPHLIKLYDMGQDGDSWFLTMEYLDGEDFDVYLNPEDVDPAAAPDAPAACGPRMLSAFRQLARGIHALHEAGLLHRDLKPSNVIVVDERVVVLDFGLVRELSASGETVTEEGSVAGTPAYMAPEQLLGKELSAASDWYAFGAMLYEAVSGQLPIGGSMLQLLRAKLEDDPVSLATLAPLAPAWLCELCMGLLARDPAARPSGEQVLARFGAVEAPGVVQSVTETVLATATEGQAGKPLFGRSRELAQLWSAFDQVRCGRAVVAHVLAPSGAGKSSLVEHFLDELLQGAATPASEMPLVLRSRCYELEAMPFKALDGVMDALVSHLLHLDDLDVAHLLPADVAALARVFPVLERLSAVKRVLTKVRIHHDALETRRRAELALRSLLEGLATRSPVVVWVDDLQWGDLDSARILKTWIAQPSVAPLLFVFSYRGDELATSTCLLKLVGERSAEGTPAPEHTIELKPLGSDEVRALCELRLRVPSERRATLIERIVQDAQGSPFLASQLIALADAKAARGDESVDSLSLDAMVSQTSALLGTDAKQLLAVLAVAGRPVIPHVAFQSAGVKRGGRGLLHELRTLNLVRTREVAGARTLEIYHDRVRERIREALDATENAELQRRLFKTLEVSGQADPDWLHDLALGAGLLEQALQYGKSAAEHANLKLAFERAAGLYEACLKLASGAEVGELFGKLSVACARAGRGVDAAAAALEAAKHASGAAALSWLHVAASHYLRTGHFAEGEALVQRVLDAEQIKVPKSETAVLAAIAWERARLKLSGLRAREVGEAAPDPGLLEHVDLWMVLYRNTQMNDPLSAALFQLRALRCALEAGEPVRLVRALCAASVSATHHASDDAARDSDALFERARAVNSKLAVSDDLTLQRTRAIGAFNLGRMQVALDAATEAERLFQSDPQQDPTGNYWTRLVTASIRVGALHWFGDYARFIPELRTLLADAAANDNRVVPLQLTYCETLAEQIQGEPEKSRARLERQMASLSAKRFGMLHILHAVSVMSAACATGEYAWADAYLAEVWPRFLKSTLRRAAYLAQLAFEVHSRLLLNQRVAGSDDANLLREARSDLKALTALSSPQADLDAQRVRARLAQLGGDRQAAISTLRACRELRIASGAKHEAAREQYALGALLGGSEGGALCAAAKEQIRGLGVVDVEASLRWFYPELMERAQP